MLITNATVVTAETPNRVIPDQAVLIAGGRIEAMGPTRKLEVGAPQEQEAGCRRAVTDAGIHLRAHSFLCSLRRGAQDCLRPHHATFRRSLSVCGGRWTQLSPKRTSG